MLKFKHRLTGEIDNVQLNMPDAPRNCEDDSPASNKAFSDWEKRCQELRRESIEHANKNGWDLIPSFSDWNN